MHTYIYIYRIALFKKNNASHVFDDAPLKSARADNRKNEGHDIFNAEGMYMCMYVCMYVCMENRMNEGHHFFNAEGMYMCVYVCMYVCMY